jgi:hypothetical protein
MANLNIRKPRFYVDRLNYLLNRGISNSEFYLNSGVGQLDTITTGSVAELFDMRPLNQVTFDTSGNKTEDIVLSIDQNFGSYKTGFIAILNHNMFSADAQLTVSYSNTESHVQTTGMASATDIAGLDDIFNASNSGNVITPTADGHTLFTFTEFANRFIGLEFGGTDSGNFDSITNLSIGCIIVGEYYDMPHSPDLSVKRSIEFDKQKLEESLGGQRFSTLSSHGKGYLSASNKSPFHTYTGNGERGLYGGRMTYDMKFSYLNSSDVMPSTYDIQNQADDTVVSDIWNYTQGSHIPFIFTQDGESHDESDYLFARFGKNSLDMTQVAPDVFDVSMRIEEEF